MRLRQIALIANEPEPVVDHLCAVLGLEVCFRDPGVAKFGLHNALLPIGTSFLEVLAPVREGTTAGRLLQRRGGDGGYMVIVQTDDLEAGRKRVAELGIRVVWEAKLSDAATIHLHPRDVGAAIVSPTRCAIRVGLAGPEWRKHVRTDVTRALSERRSSRTIRPRSPALGRIRAVAVAKNDAASRSPSIRGGCASCATPTAGARACRASTSAWSTNVTCSRARPSAGSRSAETRSRSAARGSAWSPSPRTWTARPSWACTRR
jgi:hypothetical protein